MKAVIHPEYGAPEVLQIKEIDKPTPKDKELLIKVYATTVNRTDCAILRAKPFIMRFTTGLVKPGKQVPGTDFAGIIEAVGKKVQTFKVGDKVFGFDDNGLKSQAEHMVVDYRNAIGTIPENMTYEQAAASIEGAHYAYNFINKINLKSGHKVLVNGAAGAIGSALVQLLKYYGAKITAVGNTRNMDLMKFIGADRVIDFTKEDFTKMNHKFHYVFDAVGKSSFKKCKPLLENGGIYISSELGQNSQNLFLSLSTSMFGNKKVVFPFPLNRLRSVNLVKELMSENEFSPVIDKWYELEQIKEAYKYVETGEKTGSVVLRIR